MKYSIILFLILTCIPFINRAQRITVKEYPKPLTEMVNTQAEELLPILSADGDRLYFVRSFYEHNIGGKNAGQDIWFTDKDQLGRWKEAVNLRKLNSELNNAVIGINGSNSLFLLNSYVNRATTRTHGIALTYMVNDKWTAPVNFPLKIQVPGDVRSYYISPEQDVIIYATESVHSYGKEDLHLYYKERNSWKGPIHLDQNINSPGSEISPFLSYDKKVLFFSSNGHEGVGGFDIYMTERLDESSWNQWTPVTNMGDLINTKGFDAYFSTYPSGQSYYTSEGHSGSLDIHSTQISIAFESQSTDNRVVPGDSAIQVLNTLALNSDQLDEVIKEDASYLLRLARFGLFQDALLLNLVVSHSKVNTALEVINTADRVINKNTIRLVNGTEGTEVFTGLRNESVSQQNIINTTQAACHELANDLASRTRATRLMISSYSSTHELEILGLLAANVRLKKVVSNLFDQNARLKIQLHDAGNFTSGLIRQLNENNDLLQSIYYDWKKNLNQINQAIENSNMEGGLLSRIRHSLTFADSINLVMKDYLVKDLMMENANGPAGTSMESLKERLVRVNKNYTPYIQNLQKRFTYGYSYQYSNQRLSLKNSAYAQAILESASPIQSRVSEPGGQSSNYDFEGVSDPRPAVLPLIAQNAKAYLELDTLVNPANLKAIQSIETNNLKLAEKMLEWGVLLQQSFLGSARTIRETRTILIDPSALTDNMKISGYTVQIVATNRGIPPNENYMAKFRNETVRMTSGMDGLDRYYIRIFDTKREAVRNMRKLRARGFSDVFVRAIAEYNEL